MTDHYLKHNESQSWEFLLVLNLVFTFLFTFLYVYAFLVAVVAYWFAFSMGIMYQRVRWFMGKDAELKSKLDDRDLSSGINLGIAITKEILIPSDVFAVFQTVWTIICTLAFFFLR